MYADNFKKIYTVNQNQPKYSNYIMMIILSIYSHDSQENGS